MLYPYLPACLQDLGYYCCGCDSTTTCCDLLCISSTSLLCCGSCIKGCCTQRSIGRRVADYDPLITLLSSESPAVHRLVGRSFAGTEKHDAELAIDWLVGPHYKSRTHPKRGGIFYCMMAGAVEMEGDQGLVLGVKKSPEIDNSEIEAVLVAKKVHRSSNKDCRDCISLCSMTGVYCRLACCRNECPWEVCCDQKIGAPMDARNQVADKFLKESKAFSVGKEVAYWYVVVMAVDPSAQGKGHCSRLMRAICEQADRDGLATHLECSGDRNRAVYERFGFYPVRRMTLVAEKGDEEGSVPMDKGYAMYRPAKGKKITDIHQVIDCSVPTASTIETQVMDREGSEIL